MSEFETLLELADLDTHIDQLRHRRANDPLHEMRREAEVVVATTESRLADAESRRDAVRRDQSRLEDEVSSIGEKISHFDAQLYDGSVTAHKELEAIQAEIAHLGDRKNGIEDAVISQMELAEPLDTEMAGLRDTLRAAEAESERIARDLTALEAEIDVELEEHITRRAATVSTIDGALLSTYESLREQLTPAAVRLAAGGRCEGCHLELPRADYAQAKRAPEDEILSCPECGRILVR